MIVKTQLKQSENLKVIKLPSIASSNRAQDLSGYFLKVKNKKQKVLDLFDTNCSHYLVTKGSLTLHVEEGEQLKSVKIKQDDAVWLGAYARHGFSGEGSLVKISDGQNINYLEKIDLINTYNLDTTLLRGRKDKQNWGYDSK